MDWLLEQRSWLHAHEIALAWAGFISLLTLVGSALAVPIMIRRIPHDYFLENSEATQRMRRQHPALRMAVLILKNVLGLILLVTGFIMLLIPGQGMLTMLAGILLLNFPGKRRFEVWLIRRKAIYRTVNWIRRRANQKSLSLPPIQK